MAIRTLRLDEEWEFVSKYDQAEDPAEQTIFLLGNLSSRVVSFLQDGSTKFRPTQGDDGKADSMEADFLPNSLAYEVVRFGLRGVRNLQDPDGNPVQFQTAKRTVRGTTQTCAVEVILKALPLDLIRELSEEIQKNNSLDEADTKNSDG